MHLPLALLEPSHAVLTGDNDEEEYRILFCLSAFCAIIAELETGNGLRSACKKRWAKKKGVLSHAKGSFFIF
jgi:hypothetical protein